MADEGTKSAKDDIDAIGVALIVFSAVVAAFGIWAVWRIVDPIPENVEDLKTRTELVRNIGLFVLGVIGLPLVIWRSMTASRQTREAIIQGSRVERQLAYTARQIAASEESNLAKLLQDGAKLLADSNGANVTAGIATLSVVARTDPEPFGNQARVLLLDYVQNYGAHTHTGLNVERAIAALDTAYRTRPDEVRESLHFEEDDELSQRHDDYDTDWAIVRGARSCSYAGGRFIGKALDETLSRFRFRHTTFLSCDIQRIASLSAQDCTFNKCRFKEVDSGSLTRNKLSRCDLSGVRMVVNVPLPDLRAGNNFFNPDTPPTVISEHPIELSAVLHVGEPPRGIFDF